MSKGGIMEPLNGKSAREPKISIMVIMVPLIMQMSGKACVYKGSRGSGGTIRMVKGAQNNDLSKSTNIQWRQVQLARRGSLNLRDQIAVQRAWGHAHKNQKSKGVLTQIQRKEETEMKDLQKKLEQMEEPGKFQTMYELPRSKRAGAVIRCAESADEPYLWQVVTKYSDTYFKTLREVQDYCRENNWI
jgi:hypothetical protein